MPVVKGHLGDTHFSSKSEITLVSTAPDKKRKGSIIGRELTGKNAGRVVIFDRRDLKKIDDFDPRPRFLGVKIYSEAENHAKARIVYISEFVDQGQAMASFKTWVDYVWDEATGLLDEERRRAEMAREAKARIMLELGVESISKEPLKDGSFRIDVVSSKELDGAQLEQLQNAVGLSHEECGSRDLVKKTRPDGNFHYRWECNAITGSASAATAK